MKILTYLLLQALTLAPILALANAVSETAAIEINGRFDDVLNMLRALNASIS